MSFLGAGTITVAFSIIACGGAEFTATVTQLAQVEAGPVAEGDGAGSPGAETGSGGHGDSHQGAGAAGRGVDERDADVTDVLPADVAARPTDAPGCEHDNGLGQQYASCAPLGTPGDDRTYSMEMANAAAQAWEPQGVIAPLDKLCAFFAASCLSNTSGTACAVWCYAGGGLAGRVLANTSTTCQCPGGTSPHWN